jgi:hypothetical protein
MWQVDNRTPFAARQSWVRDQNGAETWLIVVKATFDIRADGTTAVSEEQPEPARTPVWRGEPGQSSLIYENDFVLNKKTTDVVLNGTAYARDGREVNSLDVALQVGSVKKALKVFGNRVWGPAGVFLSEPLPFVQMPITYERAFGGVDLKSPHPEKDWYWPNPVGAGFVSGRSRISGVWAPNIEYPDQLISSWRARPKPAGLGFIGSHWKERAAFAGTYDEAWSAQRQPLLPVDFDLRHYQGVPNDQQAPAFLLGGEPVGLLNLTPSGILRFFLPKLELALETRFMDGERREHIPDLHTVILQPDLPRVSLVWHSAMECHAKAYKLQRTRVRLRSLQGEPVREEVNSLLDLVS